MNKARGLEMPYFELLALQGMVLPRYPHSPTKGIRISVLKTRKKGPFGQTSHVLENGKKGRIFMSSPRF